MPSEKPVYLYRMVIAQKLSGKSLWIWQHMSLEAQNEWAQRAADRDGGGSGGMDAATNRIVAWFESKHST